MEKEIIYSLTKNFESFANTSEEGIEFWLARDLQRLLGYDKWDNFKNVISKAQTAWEVSGQPISDHFADVGKTIIMPKNAEKVVEDLMLSRYACYLIAQNGDPRKLEIAFAQTYFAVQTRKAVGQFSAGKVGQYLVGINTEYFIAETNGTMNILELHAS